MFSPPPTNYQLINNNTHTVHTTGLWSGYKIMVLQPQEKDQYNFLGEYIKFIEKNKNKAPTYLKIADRLDEDKILTIIGDTKGKVWWIEKTYQEARIPHYLYDNLRYYMRAYWGYRPLF